MEITLEKIELVKDRTGVTYKEAKEALEESDGSVVDAIINIEESVNYDSNTEKSGKLNGSELFDRMKKTADKGNMSRIVVKRNDEIILNFPLTVSIVGAVIAPWGVIFGAIAAVGFNCKVEFVNDKGETTDVNGKVKKHYGKVKEQSKNVKEKSANTFDKMKDNEAYDGFKKRSTETYETLKNKSTETYESLKNKSVNRFDDLKDKSADKIDDLKDKSADKIDDLKDKSADKIEDLKDKSADKIDDLKDKSADKIDELKNKQNLEEIREKGSGLFRRKRSNVNTGVSDEEAKDFVEKVDEAIEDVAKETDFYEKESVDADSNKFE